MKLKNTKVKNNKIQISGITLVSLVISIAILLILAGISLKALSGENGLVKRAKQANLSSAVAKEKDQIGQAYNLAQANNITKNIGMSELQYQLDKTLPDKNICFIYFR